MTILFALIFTDQVISTLNVLADSVLQEQPLLRRRKLEHLINEFVHKRTVTRNLVQSRVSHPKAFEWLCQMRFYFDPKQTDTLKQLSIHMANARFAYGFEYLGVQDRLVQTPLTDRCYLTMTQALESRLGGSPFGPAGTGKTESVKALGHQLGRFVLVFNCDETFDFQAMGRIFVGLCQVPLQFISIYLTNLLMYLAIYLNYLFIFFIIYYILLLLLYLTKYYFLFIYYIYYLFIIFIIYLLYLLFI